MRGIVAIQMDAPETIRPLTDSTLLLGLEAARRDYEVLHYHPSSLTFEAGNITARARPITFREDPDNYFSAGQWRMLDMRTAKVVLMRQDPPFDMAYITATYLLEMLRPDVLVVNEPAAVRSAPEKLFMFRFPGFVPPTLVTRDAEAVRAFLREQGDIVLKPLYGFAGQSVVRIQRGDTNLHAVLEMFFAMRNEPVIAQRYLPEIRSMDKRLIVIDGKLSCVLGRIPAEGDIRANFRVGGSGVAVEPSPRDREIAETVGMLLAEQGILFAGLDVIGDYLTEINVTCPTGLPKSNALYSIHQERTIWDAIEARLS